MDVVVEIVVVGERSGKNDEAWLLSYVVHRGLLICSSYHIPSQYSLAPSSQSP